jgi:hypothetical protein
MAYRTLAWVMALICGLAIPAGAGTLADGFFDQQIYPAEVGEKLVNTAAMTRGVITSTIGVKGEVLESGILAATTAQSNAASIIVADNALLVSVHGDTLVGKGKSIDKTYNKATVASLNNSFNNSTGVANINMAAGNLNVQTINYSGPDLSSNGLLANGGSAKPSATRK